MHLTEESIPLVFLHRERTPTSCLLGQWDTANVYSNGESERLMGKAIRAYNIPRQKVVIMTKCYRVICDQENHDPGSGITMLTGLADQSKDYVNQWGMHCSFGNTFSLQTVNITNPSRFIERSHFQRRWSFPWTLEYEIHWPLSSPSLRWNCIPQRNNGSASRPRQIWESSISWC